MINRGFGIRETEIRKIVCSAVGVLMTVLAAMSWMAL